MSFDAYSPTRPLRMTKRTHWVATSQSNQISNLCAPFRRITEVQPSGGTMARILSGCPSPYRSSRMNQISIGVDLTNIYRRQTQWYKRLSFGISCSHRNVMMQAYSQLFYLRIYLQHDEKRSSNYQVWCLIQTFISFLVFVVALIPPTGTTRLTIAEVAGLPDTV